MALGSLSELDEYSRHRQFPSAWDEVEWGRVFWNEDDDLDGALRELLRSATHSIFGAVNLGSGDIALIEALINRLSDPDVYVQLLVEGAEAATIAVPAVAPWSNASVVRGPGEYRWRCIFVIDASDVVTGSGEDLVVIRDPTFAAYYQAHLAREHTQALALLAHHHQEAV
jgi:hypothetical protein